MVLPSLEILLMKWRTCLKISSFYGGCFERRYKRYCENCNRCKFVFYSVGHGNHDNGKEYIGVANGGRVYIKEDITDKF